MVKTYYIIKHALTGEYLNYNFYREGNQWAWVKELCWAKLFEGHTVALEYAQDYGTSAYVVTIRMEEVE